MSNPLFQKLGGAMPNNNFSQIVKFFRMFKQGNVGIDPKQEVMKCLQSGMISQNDLNKLQVMSQQFGFLK